MNLVEIEFFLYGYEIEGSLQIKPRLTGGMSTKKIRANALINAGKLRLLHKVNNDRIYRLLE